MRPTKADISVATKITRIALVHTPTQKRNGKNSQLFVLNAQSS